MKMQTVKLNKLVDGEVSHVSLVERGANMAPFKIVKSQEGNEGMSLDLGKIFLNKKDSAPSVAIVAVSKTADLAAAKARIEKAGLSVDHMEEHDDGVTFKQDQEYTGEVAVLKLDDDLAVGIANPDSIIKMFESFNFESLSFDDVMSQEGVYPSIRLAKSVLSTTLSNILDDADDGQEALTSVKSALGEFSNFVEAVIGGIPDTAFKLDSTVVESTKSEDSDDSDSADVKKEDTSEDVSETEESQKTAESEESEDAGDKEVTDKTDGAEESDADVGAEDAQKTDESADAGDIGKLVSDAVKSSLDGVVESIGKLSDRIGTVEELAKSADDSAKTTAKALGTVVVADDPEDEAPLQTKQKSSEDEFTGVFDTAVQKRDSI